MFSKKQIFIMSFTLAIIFHFLFYFQLYGPNLPIFNGYIIYILAIVSALLMMIIYFFTKWRLEMKGNVSLFLYEALVVWIFVSFVRSIFQMGDIGEMVPFLFYNFLGISLFPVLFFTIGVSVGYVKVIDRMLTFYIITSFIISLFFLNHFELQIFLLLPIFYLIITTPLKPKWEGIMIFVISIVLVIISLTNRAGILRVLISYCILAAMFIVKSMRVSKYFIKFAVFCLLLIPVASLYLGMQGKSVFQLVLGEDIQPYSQMNPYADTRTLLYYEVFQDLRINNAFLFGKGLNAGYASDSFTTFDRPVVEVGFLHLLLKTGILGCLLYFSILVTAIFKSIGRSKSYFIKSLGLLLAGYLLMFFVENILAYNLLNIIIWIVIGMCLSERMRGMSDSEIRILFSNSMHNY